MPAKLRPWQKIAFWLGLLILLIFPLVSGYFLARAIIAAGWPEKRALLTGLLLLLVVAVPLILAGLRWLERRKAAYDRVFTNTWFLIILSGLFFAVLVALPGFLLRVSVAFWANTTVGAVQSLAHRTYLDADTGLTNEYSVAYAFHTQAGRYYQGLTAVSRDYFETLAEDEPVTVYYMPFFPRYSLLNFNIEAETADYALILWAVVAAIYLYIGETALLAPTIYRIQATHPPI